MVHWHECVHSVVTSPLLEVPSAENPTADCPLAHHHNVSAGRSRYRPLPVTPRSNTYILLFTDRFSRRKDMLPVTAAELPRRVQPISW